MRRPEILTEISSDKMVLIRREEIGGKTVETVLRAPTTLVRKSDSQTSADAAAKVCPKITEQESWVLAILADFPMGATTYEMAATGRIKHSVCEKRMADMERKGLVWRVWNGFSDSGRAIYESRANENGNQASVWRKR